MQDEARPYIVHNRRRGPVELHVGERVLCLPARGSLELLPSERHSPQLRVLEGERLVFVRLKDPPVNVNTATQVQLEQGLGLPPQTARQLLAFRQKHGRFRASDELRRVKGIGKAKIEKLADRIVLRS